MPLAVPLLSRLTITRDAGERCFALGKIIDVFGRRESHVRLTVYPAESLDECPPDTLILRYQAAAINARGS